MKTMIFEEAGNPNKGLKWLKLRLKPILANIFCC